MIRGCKMPVVMIIDQWQPEKARFNYIVDIYTKWQRSYFYFCARYHCPGPNARTPFFESKFARLEHLGGGYFALAFARHTGEWVGEIVGSRALALDAQGRPHLGYSSLDAVKYAFYDSQTWQVGTVYSGEGVLDAALVLDADGLLHLGFASGGRVWYAGGR